MNTPTRVAVESALARLRRRAAVGFLAASVATGIAGAVGGAIGDLPASDWIGWIAIAVAVLGIEFRLVASRLGENHRPDAIGVSPILGVANGLTLLRGVLLAWVAGFLAFGIGWLATPGWIEPSTIATASRLVPWLPALCYGAAALLDAADGFLARFHGRVTTLGTHLDTAYDGLGVLLAVAVGVFGGAIPAWYLAVGLARYAFVGGMRLRRSRGLPVYRLPDRTSGRLLAGIQMAFLTVALSPAVGTAGAAVGSLLVGVPFLLGFGRDWLHVSGRHPGVDYSTASRR